MAAAVEPSTVPGASQGTFDAVNGICALYSKQQLCDMEFQLLGQAFPAHRAVLSCASMEFRTFLRSVAEAKAGDAGAEILLAKMLSIVQPHAGPEATAATLEPSAQPASSQPADAAPPADGAAADGLLRQDAAASAPPDAGAPAACEAAPQADAAAAAAAVAKTSAMNVETDVAGKDAAAPQTEATAAMDMEMDVVGEDATKPAGQPRSGRLELQVAGIEHAEALMIMLQYVYDVGAASPWKYEPSSKEVNKDVMRLAKHFGLHHLHEYGARWLTKKLTTSNVVETLVTMDEFDLGWLREKVIEQLAWKPEELGIVSTSPEIMQHPRILQDILVKVAAQRGKKKDPPREPEKPQAGLGVEDKKRDTGRPEAELATAKEAAAETKEAELATAKEAADKTAAETKAAAKAAEARAAAAAAELKAATAAAEAAAAMAAAEKAADEKAAADRAAQKLAEERVAAERVAAERAAQKAAEERLAADRVAAERAAQKAAEERLVAERAAQEKAEQQAAREAEAARKSAALAEKAAKAKAPGAKAAVAKGPVAKRQKKA